MAQFLVPSMLERRTHSRVVETSGRTLREAIDDVDRKYRGFRDDLLSDGGLRGFFRVMIDGKFVDDIDAPIGEHVNIEILAPRVGG
jgi:hypothetical protein